MIIWCKKYNFPCHKIQRRVRPARYKSTIEARLKKGVVWLNYTLQFGGKIKHSIRTKKEKCNG